MLRSRRSSRPCPKGGPGRSTASPRRILPATPASKAMEDFRPECSTRCPSDGARLAVFAQGPVLKRSHLTLSLDTDRQSAPYRLFDRFAPDAFLPGDRRHLGRGRHGASPRTAVRPPRRTGRVHRRGRLRNRPHPRGAGALRQAAHRRLGTLPATAGSCSTGSRPSTEQKQSRDIFAPDGTSGPYLLSHRPVVAYSEAVIVETRDRWHPRT
jgi:hypothetical protein